MKRKPRPVRPGVADCAHCGGAGKRSEPFEKFGNVYTRSVDCICVGGHPVQNVAVQRTIFKDGKALAAKSEE